MHVLFLTDRSQRHQQAALAAMPPGVTVQVLHRPSREQVLAAVVEADVLISERAGEIDAAIIAAGKRLRLIQRLGSLYHDIDLAAARAAGIPVCIWPLPGAIAVAEHAIWQMLALARRSHQVEAAAQEAGDWGPSRRTDENTFAVNWSRQSGLVTLWGKTVGILGFGEIGVETARRLRGFGVQVRYHKRRPLPAAVEEELGVAFSTVEALLAESDFVCNLLPYAAETDMLLDEAALARMKPGAFLVSCGSGSVIDEAALARAITSGRLAGAALDTFEWEPLRPDNPLLPLARTPAANVILTPHVAFLGPDATRREEFENLRRLLAGEPLLHRVA